MDENNLNPMVDTTLWNMNATAPTPVNIPVTTMPYQTVAPLPNIKEISPDIDALVGSIRFDATNKLAGTANSESDLLNKLFPDRNKIDLTTEVPLSETHQKLSDGTWIPKYKSYIPGIDNDTRLANQQTDWEKFFNPIKRFVANTSKAPLDLISGVYGIGAAALSGRFDAIYDNDFAHYVDDWTERTNFEYKNYYNQKERNQDLGANIQTWDKVLGGAEFTARMLASEAIIAVLSDGTSLPSSLAKIGLKTGLAAEKIADSNKILQVGKDIAQMMKIAQAPELSTAAKGAGNVASSGSRMLGALETAANRGKLADNLVKARFAITSPMYEAGFEARHFQKEAEEQFWNYYNERGIQPTPDEVNAFASKLAGASNGVFVTNMAILAPSNLAMVGDMLNIKGKTAKWITSANEGITRNLFKIGTEVGKDGTYQALKSGFFNKAAAYTTPFIKGALVEGLYEEGSQGIASSTFKNYVASSYNPEAMKSTVNYIDSFSKAFADQFGTKEGMEEILIGALIGGLMGGVGGARTTAREYRAQSKIADIQNAGTEFADNLRSNVYTNEQLLSLFSSAGRFQNLRAELEKADQQGDNLKQASLQAQSFISLLDAYHSVGKGSEFTDMVKNVMTGIDNQYIADSTGLNINQVEDFKKEQSQDIDELANKYSTALEAGRFLFGNKVGGFSEVQVGENKVKVSGQNLANALAFSSTMALFNEKYASESYNAFQVKLAQLNASNDLIEQIGAIATIKKASAVELESYYQLNGEETRLKNDINKITDKINQLNASEEKTISAIERVELANKLTAIQTQLQQVTANKESLWKSMTDNLYSKMGITKYIPQIDLENFTKQVKDIGTSLENTSYATEDKVILNQLLDQFDEANTAYKSFADMANKIADPKFSYKTYNHLFSGLRARLDKSINEHTRDTLLQLYGQGINANRVQAQNMESLQRSPSPITEDVITSEETPDTSNIEYVYNKLKNRRVLTENEQAFYDKFKEDIDSYQSTDITDPLNADSEATIIDDFYVKRNSIEQDINNLDNGVYTESLQNDINKIQQEIDDLSSSDVEVFNDGHSGEEVAKINAKRQSELENLNAINDDEIINRELQEAEINDKYDAEIESLPIIDTNELVLNRAAKINELQESIVERVQQERISLEDDLATLEGEISAKEKKNRLQQEYNTIRNEIMGEESIDISKLKRMLAIQRELTALDNINQPFNANGTPLEQLNWIINNISGLNFETVEDLAGIERPTQEYVDEYIDLLNTKNKNTIQRKRLSELRQQLLPFNLAEGLSLDGVNVLDIINLYNQNKGVQNIAETQQSDLPEAQLQAVIKDVQQQSKQSEYRSAKVGLVYDGAYIERKKNGYGIYHVKLNTMLEQAIGIGNTPTVTVYSQDNQGNRVVEEEIIVFPENVQEIANRFDGKDNIKVDLSESMSVVKGKNAKSFTINGDINEMLNLIGATPYAITGQPTNYVLLYNQNSDGSLQAREAEFNITNQGVELEFDKEVLNSIKPGDTVTLEFDPNDDFNKKLNSDAYIEQGRIYVKKNGKLVNILKGTDVSKTEKDSWTELEAVRKKVVKAGLNSKANKIITVTVTNSFLGFPNITLNADGTAKEIPVDESKVLAYGYMDEYGILQGDISKLDLDNIQYITPLSTLGKKSPVMAVKAYGQIIAFPVNLKPQGIDLTSDIDVIANDETLSRERKIFEINAILDNHGLFNTDLALTNANFDINKVKEALTTVYDQIDITDSQQFNQADKTAFIDLNDPFKSTKLVFDLGSAEEEIQSTEKEAKEKSKKTITTKEKKGRNKSDENQC